MKKYFLLAAAAATVLAVSCNKEKNQPKVDPTPGTEIEDNTPQPIRFGVSTVDVKSPITKAAIENTTAWPLIGGNPQKLYIYGFELDNTGAPQIAAANALLNNVPANAPTAFTGPNALVNGDQREAIVVQKANNEPYYYGENGQVYSFYGYYVGSAAADPTPTFASNKVSLDLTIDGSQDIMLATTDKFADYIAAGSPSVSLEKVYSEVSARKTVKPDLKFKHQLARFKFETKYGGATEADGAHIMIDTLLLKSLKAGTLTIASADEDDLGFVPTGAWNQLAEGDTLILRNSNGSRAKGTPGLNTTYGTFAQLGESIMTFPQGMNNTTSPKYTIHLGITQNDGVSPAHHFSRDLDIDFATVVDANGDPILNKYAEAGKMYVIRLVIYGAEKIEMTVSLEDWEYGGETEIDPDQDTRPATTITINSPSPASFNFDLAGTTSGTITASATSTGATAAIPIKYASSNKKVATVGSGGEVQAVGAGTCKIYVYVDGTDDYKGALETVDVTVTGGIADVADPAPVVTATIAGNNNFDWQFVGTNAAGTNVSSITASATVNTTPVATGSWTYSVEDNPYFEVAADGTITTKDLTQVSNPTANVVVTFTATLAKSTGNYKQGQATATITVTPAP